MKQKVLFQTFKMYKEVKKLKGDDMRIRKICNFLKGLTFLVQSIPASFVGFFSYIEDIGRNPYEEYSAEWNNREKELRNKTVCL